MAVDMAVSCDDDETRLPKYFDSNVVYGVESFRKWVDESVISVAKSGLTTKEKFDLNSHLHSMVDITQRKYNLLESCIFCDSFEVLKLIIEKYDFFKLINFNSIRHSIEMGGNGKIIQLLLSNIDSNIDVNVFNKEDTALYVSNFPTYYCGNENYFHLLFSHCKYYANDKENFVNGESFECITLISNYFLKDFENKKYQSIFSKNDKQDTKQETKQDTQDKKEESKDNEEKTEKKEKKEKTENKSKDSETSETSEMQNVVNNNGYTPLDVGILFGNYHLCDICIILYFYFRYKFEFNCYKNEFNRDYNSIALKVDKELCKLNIKYSDISMQLIKKIVNNDSIQENSILNKDLKSKINKLRSNYNKEISNRIQERESKIKEIMKKRMKYSNEKVNVILSQSEATSQFIRELKIIHQFGNETLQEWIDTRKIGPGLCGYLACAVAHYIALNNEMFFNDSKERKKIIEKLLTDIDAPIHLSNNNNNKNKNDTFGSLIDKSIKFIESDRKKYISSNNELSNDNKKGDKYLIDEVANFEISYYINQCINDKNGINNNIVFFRRNQYLCGDIEKAKYIEKELILKEEKKYSPNYLYLIEMFNPNILFGLNCKEFLNQLSKRNINDYRNLLFVFDLDGHFNTGFIDKNSNDFVILDTTSGDYTQNQTIKKWIKFVNEMNQIQSLSKKNQSK